MKTIKASDLLQKTLEAARAASDLGALDGITDYVSTSGAEDCTISDMSFDLVCSILPGSCEGIFLNVDMYGIWEEGQRKNGHKYIGCIKTLDEGKEGYRIMGEAAGLITFHARQVIWESLR